MNVFKIFFPSECSHKWNIVTKTYAPAAASNPSVTDKDTLEKALFGVSSYMWECKTCGALRKQEMLGSDDPTPLEKIIENVEREGLQYLKFNGNVYAVAKWAPKTTDAIPVR